jgi:hypothetical protein
MSRPWKVLAIVPAMIPVLIAPSCSKSSPEIDFGGDAMLPDGPAGKDAGTDALAPAPEVPLPDAPGRDVAVPDEAPADGNTPDVTPCSRCDAPPQASEVAVAAEVGADATSSCYYNVFSGRYMLKHFAFLLTTPDGQSQSPPTYLHPAPDGGGWPIHDFEGRITEETGNQFSIDTCVSPGCQPSLYQFTLCDSLSCEPVASPAPVQLSVPVGRRVRVVWRLENNVPAWCPGLYWLAIYDAEPGASQGNLLFLGSGGRKPDPAGSDAVPFQDLPFAVGVKPLGCGRTSTDAPAMGDDYAFVFSPKSGVGTSVEVATGESRRFDFAWPAGNSQSLEIHCLDAVQPDHTDDYWNWDFWATGEAAPPPLDGGQGGG